MPKAYSSRAQSGVEYFQCDAAHILVDEEIFSGELQIIQGAHRVEEERIAPPAREEAVVSALRHQRFSRNRDCRPLYDRLSIVAYACSPLAFDTAHSRSLRAVLVFGKAHSVGDV